jgi:hypothetical protein
MPDTASAFFISIPAIQIQAESLPIKNLAGIYNQTYRHLYT